MSITTLGWGSQGGLVTTLGWGSRVVDTVEVKACLASINELLATLETTGDWSATLVTTAETVITEWTATLASNQEMLATLETATLFDLEATLEEAVLVATLVSFEEMRANLEAVPKYTATIEEQVFVATLESTGLSATLETEAELTATLLVEHCVC